MRLFFDDEFFLDDESEADFESWEDAETEPDYAGADQGFREADGQGFREVYDEEAEDVQYETDEEGFIIMR